jgi:membrane fusion protein, multidrug efflux system
MKSTRITITIIITALLMVAFAARLISNKKYFNRQLALAAATDTEVPVTTDTVKSEKVNNSFRESGTFSPLKEVSILSETQGRIMSLKSNIGDRVSKGDILAVADNDVLRSRLDIAQFNLKKAEADMKRFETLSKGDAVTPQQLESVRLALLTAQSDYATVKKQYDDTFIRATCSGYISGRHIEEGGFILQSQAAFDIIDITNVKLLVKLTDAEMLNIKEGETAVIKADAYPAMNFSGKIISINPKGDQSKRFEVEIEVKNDGTSVIKPGMTGTANFSGISGAEGLIIPRKALTGSIIDPEVFVADGNSARLKKIVAEPLDDHRLLVKQGLGKGEIVITSGQINLVDGSKISICKK